jgi:hypothetical protein
MDTGINACCTLLVRASAEGEYVVVRRACWLSLGLPRRERSDYSTSSDIEEVPEMQGESR